MMTNRGADRYMPTKKQMCSVLLSTSHYAITISQSTLAIKLLYIIVHILADECIIVDITCFSFCILYIGHDLD